MTNFENLNIKYKKLKRDGIRKIAERRLKWYKNRLQVNNAVVGRAVEIFGNRVKMDGMVFSVACPYISTSHKSTLAFGLHEMEERSLIKRWLPGNMPVLEFGGGLGVVSCLVNSKLEQSEQHIVVEANQGMISVLKQNRELNNCGFEIINKAVAYNCEYVELNVDSEFVGSTINDKRSKKVVRVETTNVTELKADAGFKKFGIVCDIEGVEAEIIGRELPLLGDCVRFFMAEMHPRILGQKVVRDLLDDLVNLGFTLKEIDGDSVFFSRD